MNAAGSNGTTTNGVAGAHAPASTAVVVRAPVDRLESWLESETKRSGLDRFELHQKTERNPEGRVVETWGKKDATGSRELAEMVLARVDNEQEHGFEERAAYELVAQPSGRFMSVETPFRPRAATLAKHGVENVAAVLLDQLRRDQEAKEKFLASAANLSVEVHALNVKAFKDREGSAVALIAAMTKGYEGQVATLTKLVDKLMAERERWVDQYLQWSADNTKNELELAREQSKTRMKEEVFGSVLKPILPLITTKLVGGLSKMLGGKADEKSAEKAAADKPADKAAETPETKERAVTEKQANAIRAFFAKLEDVDYLAMANALSDEKKILFVDVADAFMEGKP